MSTPLLDLTLPTIEANLALDEALLEAAVAGQLPRGVLRLWEPVEPAVIVGRSSILFEEVDETACQQRGVRVLRRVSGGAAVVTGQGCLMYAVVLAHPAGSAASLDAIHAAVLGRMREAIAAALRQSGGGAAESHRDANHAPNRVEGDGSGDGTAGVRRRGTSDLALGERKFSGNSLRVRRGWVLYHGTLLYDFPLPTVAELLRQPPRQPEYRQGRRHGEFITNLPLSGASLRQAVVAAWQAHEPLLDWPRELTERLARERYASVAWNRQR